MASDLFLENKEMLGVEGIKGNIYRRPISSVYQKTKIYTSIYIYHHIITQPTEFHLADRTPPPRLAITIHRTVLNNLFVTFYCLVNSLL